MRERDGRPRPLLRLILGEALRRTRVSQGRTLAEVARTARISMPYLSELERGRKEASSEVLAAVCDALRISLSELLTEVGRQLVDERTPRASVSSLAAYRARRAGRAASPGSTPPKQRAGRLAMARPPPDHQPAGRLISRP